MQLKLFDKKGNMTNNKMYYTFFRTQLDIFKYPLHVCAVGYIHLLIIIVFYA